MWRLVLIFYLCSWTNLIAQTVSISSTKTNAFYQWVNNPLITVVENNSCKNVIVSVDKGRLEGRGCERTYIASSDTILNVSIRVGVKKGSKTIWLSEKTYRVLKLPDPQISIGASTGGNIPKNLLLAHQRFYVSTAVDDGFGSNNNPRLAKVQAFSVKVIRSGALLFSENGSDQYLTETFKTFMHNNCKSGDEVIFDNFTIVLYEKEVRRVKQSITFTMQVL